MVTTKRWYKTRVRKVRYDTPDYFTSNTISVPLSKCTLPLSELITEAFADVEVSVDSVKPGSPTTPRLLAFSEPETAPPAAPAEFSTPPAARPTLSTAPPAVDRTPPTTPPEPEVRPPEEGAAPAVPFAAD